MKTIICYTAGSSRGNPGLGAVGVYITDEADTMLCEEAQTIGNTTHLFAEYHAVLLGLQTLLSVCGEVAPTTQFSVRLENEIVTKQLNATLPITEPGLIPMFIEIHNMQIEHFHHLTFSTISPAENQVARHLVSEALDAAG
jgi:ribonuclease HI